MTLFMFKQDKYVKQKHMPKNKMCSTHSLILIAAVPYYAQMEVQWLLWLGLLTCPPL